MIEISDLTVHFGGVIPLDAMSVTFESVLGKSCIKSSTCGR